jgi:hypothetical protein
LPLVAPAWLHKCSILGVEIAGGKRDLRKDKAFREHLRAVMERDREILERLAR